MRRFISRALLALTLGVCVSGYYGGPEADSMRPIPVSVSWTPASVIVGGSTQNCTVTQAMVGDFALVIPPPALSLSLNVNQVTQVTTNGQVPVRIGNGTLGGIVPASGTWQFILMHPL